MLQTKSDLCVRYTGLLLARCEIKSQITITIITIITIIIIIISQTYLTQTRSQGGKHW